jgi:hypothetical protein
MLRRGAIVNSRSTGAGNADALRMAALDTDPPRVYGINARLIPTLDPASVDYDRGQRPYRPLLDTKH